VKTAAILLKASGALASDDALAAALAEVAQRGEIEPAGLHAHAAENGGELYAYLELRAPVELGAEDATRVAEIARGVQSLRGLEVSAARLARMLDVPGASSGARAPYHYVVETDAAEGWLDEMMRWYDREHLPGLAAVPGCVRAQRFVNLDGGSRSFACYDLVARETLGSPPWLAVRGSAWSGRVRPNFRNTKRTMFRSLARIAL
jgi:hypothetical protein